MCLQYCLCSKVVLSVFKSSARSNHTMFSTCTVRQRPIFPSYSKLTYMQNTQMYVQAGGIAYRYSESLGDGLSGVRTPVETTFSGTIQTGSEAHPASCTTGTGFPSQGYSSRGVE